MDTNTETRPVKLSRAQQERLARVVMKGDEGMAVSQVHMGRFITLFKARLVVRGPMPPRYECGGRLCYPQRVFATQAGREAYAAHLRESSQEKDT